MKTTVFVRKVSFEDGSYFQRGECNGCDWIHEELHLHDLYPRATIHLRVFHQGGKIVNDDFTLEVMP